MRSGPGFRLCFMYAGSSGAGGCSGAGVALANGAQIGQRGPPVRLWSCCLTLRSLLVFAGWLLPWVVISCPFIPVGELPRLFATFRRRLGFHHTGVPSGIFRGFGRSFASCFACSISASRFLSSPGVFSIPVPLRLLAKNIGRSFVSDPTGAFGSAIQMQFGPPRIL